MTYPDAEEACIANARRWGGAWAVYLMPSGAFVAAGAKVRWLGNFSAPVSACRKVYACRSDITAEVRATEYELQLSARRP